MTDQELIDLCQSRGGIIGPSLAETMPAGAIGKIHEDDFQAAVLDIAARNGWRTMHIRPARTSTGWRTPVSGGGKGFPDLIAIRRGVLIVAELKVPPNKTTPEQDLWLEDFRELAAMTDSVKVFLWTPENWGEIERELR